MTDIRILSCPQCGFPRIRDVGNGLYQCDDCGTHFDKNDNIVQTNEEWFCGLSTEEKAKVLNDLYWDFDYKGRLYYNFETTEKSYERWLKQPHTFE